MPKIDTSWSASEAEWGSAVDTLRIELIGHIPNKTERVDTRFNFEGFGLVLAGRGLFQIDDGPLCPIEAPAVFYIWEGPRFRYGPLPGTSWDERYLCLTGQRVRDWQRWRWLAHPEAPRSLLKETQHAALHQQAVEAFQRGDTGDIDEAKLKMEQLVFELHRESAIGVSRSDPLKNLIAEWTGNLPPDLDLQQCARRLEMCYSGFRQKFRERTGLSVYQYVLRLRLETSCRLLIETGQQIKAIAHASGFSSVESYCRSFQRVKRMTASEYRSRHRVMNEGSQSFAHCEREVR
ncbi:MAG: helix-turn-helix transcriptional regulator [Verrucomicrobiota bacterium]